MLLGFQSDWTDPTTEHVWMGARWYQPSTATFLSRDTVFGELATPFTLNRYTYGVNNPLRFFDPDGRSADTIEGRQNDCVKKGGSRPGCYARESAIAIHSDQVARGTGVSLETVAESVYAGMEDWIAAESAKTDAYNLKNAKANDLVARAALMNYDRMLADQSVLDAVYAAAEANDAAAFDQIPAWAREVLNRQAGGAGGCAAQSVGGTISVLISRGNDCGIMVAEFDSGWRQKGANFFAGGANGILFGQGHRLMENLWFTRGKYDPDSKMYVGGDLAGTAAGFVLGGSALRGATASGGLLEGTRLGSLTIGKVYLGASAAGNLGYDAAIQGDGTGLARFAASVASYRIGNVVNARVVSALESRAASLAVGEAGDQAFLNASTVAMDRGLAGLSPGQTLAILARSTVGAKDPLVQSAFASTLTVPAVQGVAQSFSYYALNGVGGYGVSHGLCALAGDWC